MKALSIVLTLAVLTATSVSGRTWYVTPDGMGDAPTIQAGLDSTAVGDTVEVACGTYFEHDIVLKSGVHLAGEIGAKDCVTIDAQQQGRIFKSLSVDSTTIVGFTLTGGAAYVGGGIYCYRSSLSLTDCVLSGNSATSDGGGVNCSESSLTFTNCALLGNHAGAGGAVSCSALGTSFPNSITMTGCTISGNSAVNGVGGISCFRTTLTLDRCILWANCCAGANELGLGANSFVTFSCCDVDTSAGWLWFDPSNPWDVSWVGLNHTVDPQFCEPVDCWSAPTANGDYRLQWGSICLAANSGGCGQIGVFGSGNCPSVSLDARSWGHTKSGYR